MSSDLEETTELRPHVRPSPANGVLVSSQIMTNKISAVRRSRLRRVVERLDQQDLEALDQCLLVVLGLA